MAQVTVCSQINTKHINTVWAERTIAECYTVDASCALKGEPFKYEEQIALFKNPVRTAQ